MVRSPLQQVDQDVPYESVTTQDLKKTIQERDYSRKGAKVAKVAKKIQSFVLQKTFAYFASRLEAPTVGCARSL
jgi:hypothetical protein